jgi:hypothetical protein
MSEYFPDHHRIFNAGDYFDRAIQITNHEGQLLAELRTNNP